MNSSRAFVDIDSVPNPSLQIGSNLFTGFRLPAGGPPANTPPPPQGDPNAPLGSFFEEASQDRPGSFGGQPIRRNDHLAFRACDSTGQQPTVRRVGDHRSAFERAQGCDLFRCATERLLEGQ